MVRPEWVERARGEGWRFACGVDLSARRRAGNVIFTGAVNASRTTAPVEIRSGKWSSPELARQLDQVDALYSPEIVLVENNGYQQAFLDWIRNERERHPWWGRMKAFLTGSNKADPVLGLPGLEVEFENGVWRIPEREFAHHGAACDRGRDGGRCGWCRWVEETASYPHVGSDDTVMACWFFREAARMLCFETTFKRTGPRAGVRESAAF